MEGTTDLFETPELIPEKVQKVLEKWADRMSGGLGYEGCADLRDELEAIGYTYDYGLDGDPYDLRPLPEAKRKAGRPKGSTNKVQGKAKAIRQEIKHNLLLETAYFVHGKPGEQFYTQKKDNAITAKAVYYNRKVLTERVIVITNPGNEHPELTKITRVTLL